jgi:hypothetical protein
MKIFSPSDWRQSIARLLVAGACLYPSFVSAHPGHYHPDETDEFDFLRATFLHSHGALDYVLAGLFISGVAVACLHGKRRVRISALAAALGSLCLLPIF